MSKGFIAGVATALVVVAFVAQGRTRLYNISHNRKRSKRSKRKHGRCQRSWLPHKLSNHLLKHKHRKR